MIGSPDLQPAQLSPTKKALALKLHQERNHTIQEICNMMGISKSTLYNYLNKAGQDAGMA
ncbi:MULTISPECIES: helix-turn-helix domain-containing protein [Enterobacteriaceae]|uniref:helix-turn-helix domain-containing protein n=1 Tax=Enterobacteriaceae TaxID=543 RepID=UPI0024AF36F3|nr:helix-turn-helix domain-containing protein [Cronobacter dublinensis]MDI7386254.1 helix-turn-helix domain-containing protein [Cronobacter dublinensis]